MGKMHSLEKRLDGEKPRLYKRIYNSINHRVLPYVLSFGVMMGIGAYLGSAKAQETATTTSKDNLTQTENLIDKEERDRQFNRGIVCINKGDTSCAFEAFTKAIDADSQANGAYHNRGFIHYKRKDYEKAIADLTHSISNNPNFLDSYYMRALCHMEIEDYGASASDLRSVIKLSGSSHKGKKDKLSISHHYLGIIYACMDNEAYADDSTVAHLMEAARYNEFMRNESLGLIWKLANEKYRPNQFHGESERGMACKLLSISRAKNFNLKMFAFIASKPYLSIEDGKGRQLFGGAFESAKNMLEAETIFKQGYIAGELMTRVSQIGSYYGFDEFSQILPEAKSVDAGLFFKSLADMKTACKDAWK